MIEQRAIELKWPEVCGIVSDEIEDILNLSLQCVAKVAEGSMWGLTFSGQRLALPKLRRVLQFAGATQEDWEDALPDEGGNDVGGIGSPLAEKLIGRHLRVEWLETLITRDSLWLVGVKDVPETRTEIGC